MDGRVRVWDLPTRLTHWAIAVLVGLSWLSAENGRMGVHVASGLTILAVLLFRLFWGVVGSPNARIANFAPSPGAVRDYASELRDADYRPEPGHSPLGALSIFAIWALLAFHLGTGLFAVDVDGLNSGPLAEHVSFDVGRSAAEVHETTFNALLALIVLHIAAILFFLIGKRANLITPMITGLSRVHRRSAELLRPQSIIVRSIIGAAIAGGIIAVIAT